MGVIPVELSYKEKGVDVLGSMQQSFVGWGRNSRLEWRRGILVMSPGYWSVLLSDLNGFLDFMESHVLLENDFVELVKSVKLKDGKRWMELPQGVGVVRLLAVG